MRGIALLGHVAAPLRLGPVVGWQGVVLEVVLVVVVAPVGVVEEEEEEEGIVVAEGEVVVVVEGAAVEGVEEVVVVEQIDLYCDITGIKPAGFFLV